MQDDTYRFELQRKKFHLYGLIFPVLYAFTSKISMSIFLLLLTIFTVYIDILKHSNNKIKGFVEKYFSKYLRDQEKIGSFTLSGASYMVLGFLITCLLFPKGLAITSWFILIIADSIAAIVGIKYGKLYISSSSLVLSNEKSIVGGLAFFVSSIFISVVSYFFINYHTSFMIIFFSSVATAIVEFYSKNIKINDNLSIPITYCLVTVFLSLMH